MKRARVLLADDHPLMLEGLRAFLEPHLQSVGTVTDGRALVETAMRLKPDLIILDITMPLLNGIDAATQIKKACPIRSCYSLPCARTLPILKPRSTRGRPATS
jgi:DNA-binding NarL/FixJ family response regulator